MKVEKIVVPQAPTYNLIGLSEDQAKLMRYLVGRSSSVTDRDACVPVNTGYNLWNAGVKGLAV